MNAIQALSLRKNDGMRNANHGSHQSDTTSRFSKKSNIKEILVRNFFRKYPISDEISDMQQLQIERSVTSEMDSFIKMQPSINSKNLHEFENRLAQQVSLKRRSGEGGAPMQPISHARNLAHANTHARAALGSPTNQIQIQQKQALLRNKTTHVGGNQQFQLPSINSHGALINTNSLNPREKTSLRALANNSNRRSQIVGGSQDPKLTQGGGGKNDLAAGLVAMSKMRTAQQSSVQNSQRYNLRATLGHDKPPSGMDKYNHMTPAASGARNLSLVEKHTRVRDDIANATHHSLVKDSTQKRLGGNSSLMGKNHTMTHTQHQTLAHDRNTESQPLQTLSTGKQSQMNNYMNGPSKRRPVEVEDLPSDISEDEWGEIQKFGQRLHEEQQKKQKEQQQKRIKQVKEVLDQQVKLRQELREKASKEREDFDKRILDQAKKELEIERKQKLEQQQKVIEAKRQRDAMLNEVKSKQMQVAEQRQNEERDRVTKLAAELEQERTNKAQAKKQTREAAMKVIKDNMQEKRKRVAEMESNKKHEAEQVEKNMRLALEKEQLREKELQDRAKRIQDKMDSMVDVVKDNGKELQLRQEKEYIQQCIEKDEQARLQDINNKNKARAKHQQLNDVLNNQMREKRMREENDHRTNKSFMQRLLERTEVEKNEVRTVEQQRKQKLIDNQQFLLDQMRTNPTPGVSSSSAAGTEIFKKKKAQLGGMMNPEEARMNRALLKEISRIKRGEEPTGLLAHQTNNPI